MLEQGQDPGRDAAADVDAPSCDDAQADVACLGTVRRHEQVHCFDAIRTLACERGCRNPRRKVGRIAHEPDSRAGVANGDDGRRSDPFFIEPRLLGSQYVVREPVDVDEPWSREDVFSADPAEDAGECADHLELPRRARGKVGMATFRLSGHQPAADVEDSFSKAGPRGNDRDVAAGDLDSLLQDRPVRRPREPGSHTPSLRGR